jgi:hypothetical protein
VALLRSLALSSTSFGQRVALLSALALSSTSFGEPLPLSSTLALSSTSFGEPLPLSSTLALSSTSSLSLWERAGVRVGSHPTSRPIATQFRVAQASTFR